MKILAAAMALLLATSGCATIFHGDTETLRITSEPSGATVRIDEHRRGTTPLEVELPSHRGYAIRLDHEGYATAWTNVAREALIGYYVLDVIFTLGIGIYVDLATKSITGFETNDIHVTMVPGEAEPVEEKPTVDHGL